MTLQLASSPDVTQWNPGKLGITARVGCGEARTASIEIDLAESPDQNMLSENRGSRLLTNPIDVLRQSLRKGKGDHWFDINAIGVLPDR